MGVTVNGKLYYTKWKMISIKNQLAYQMHNNDNRENGKDKEKKLFIQANRWILFFLLQCS